MIFFHLSSLFAAGGNSSGGGSDTAAIRYLDYSLPKDPKALLNIQEKVQRKIQTIGEDRLYEKLRNDFYAAGKSGFQKVQDLTPKLKIFTDHFRGEVFEMRPEYISKGLELLENVAGKNADIQSFQISPEILDKDLRTLIAENWPNKQKVNLNFYAWLSLEFVYKNSKDVQLLKEAIAVHEILSLHPLKIEYTGSYSVSINIIAYFSKNSSAAHKNGLRSISDNIGMVNYRPKPPIDLERPPDEEASREPQSLSLKVKIDSPRKIKKHSKPIPKH